MNILICLMVAFKNWIFNGNALIKPQVPVAYCMDVLTISFLQEAVNSKVHDACKWSFFRFGISFCQGFLVEWGTLLQWQQDLNNLFYSHTGNIKSSTEGYGNLCANVVFGGGALMRTKLVANDLKPRLGNSFCNFNCHSFWGLTLQVWIDSHRPAMRGDPMDSLKWWDMPNLRQINVS